MARCAALQRQRAQALRARGEAGVVPGARGGQRLVVQRQRLGIAAQFQAVAGGIEQVDRRHALRAGVLARQG